MTGEVARNEIVQQRDRLFAAIEGSDRETLETVPMCGVWTPRDIVGHVVDWQEVLLATARYALGGPRPLDLPITDGEAFNASHAAARMNDRWVETKAEFQASLNGILAWLETLTPEQLAAETDYPWGSPGATVASLLYSVGHHLGEHCEDIEAWRQAEVA